MQDKDAQNKCIADHVKDIEEIIGLFRRIEELIKNPDDYELSIRYRAVFDDEGRLVQINDNQICYENGIMSWIGNVPVGFEDGELVYVWHSGFLSEGDKVRRLVLEGLCDYNIGRDEKGNPIINPAH